MRYLAALIARPGHEVAAAELVGVGVSLPAEPILNDAARAAYRNRITELLAAVEHADAIGNPDLGKRAQGELDAVQAELRRHLGLGGRSRALTNPRERARTSVQKAIRRALSKIRAADRGIEDELQRGLVTGTVCCYRPPTHDGQSLGSALPPELPEVVAQQFHLTAVVPDAGDRDVPPVGPGPAVRAARSSPSRWCGPHHRWEVSAQTLAA
jgi:hypothetical protein